MATPKKNTRSVDDTDNELDQDQSDDIGRKTTSDDDDDFDEPFDDLEYDDLNDYDDEEDDY